MPSPRRELPGLERLTDPNLKQIIRLVWDRIGVLEKQTIVVASGSLYPDQRPQLTNQDTGSLFFASDFNRLYRWDGTGWADATVSPARGEVAFFGTVGPIPQTGWALCDGRTARTSTPDGSSAQLVLPAVESYHGLQAWIRL